MEERPFKPFGKVSALTLGGGGIGNVWGKTTRQEAVETVLLAIDSGINHLDMAPMYGRGEAELVVGEALKDRDLSKLKITTKCQLGTLPDNKIYDKLNESLIESFERMKIDKVNLFLLHSQLIKDDYQLPILNDLRDSITTSLSCYYDSVIPAFERLKSEGKIDSWGIGLGEEEALISAINHEKKPEVMQCAVNMMNSIGAIGYISKKPNLNRILKECQDNEIPILAIRAVQAGALTSKMDREPHPSGRDKADFDDYERAESFRELAREWGESPASLAHRYALSIQKVSSVILGVKNTQELKECLEIEKMNQLSEEQIKELENLFT
jgi:aryl-alcohol dehydrogenase-like predicted oxidoreductase